LIDGQSCLDNNDCLTNVCNSHGLCGICDTNLDCISIYGRLVKNKCEKSYGIYVCTCENYLDDQLGTCNDDGFCWGYKDLGSLTDCFQECSTTIYNNNISLYKELTNELWTGIDYCTECNDNSMCISKYGLNKSNYCQNSADIYSNNCRCLYEGSNPVGCDIHGFCFGKYSNGFMVDCDEECQSNISSTTGITGLCVSPQPVGYDCTRNKECLSGKCSLGICTANFYSYINSSI